MGVSPALWSSARVPFHLFHKLVVRFNFFVACMCKVSAFKFDRWFHEGCFWAEGPYQLVLETGFVQFPCGSYLFDGVCNLRALVCSQCLSRDSILFTPEGVESPRVKDRLKSYRCPFVLVRAPEIVGDALGN